MNNISLSGKGKQIVLIIGLFVVLRVITAFLFCLTQDDFIALLCDLSACVMLTLFYELFSLVLGSSFNNSEDECIKISKNKKLLFALTDTAVFTLKMIFLFLPPLAMGSLVYIHIVAAAVDVLLSRLVTNKYLFPE